MASDKAIDEKNIKTLRNLQKLPENKRCFNCDSLGTTYVVPQFSIFVCTDCSGIHMQCGQRVKSISMAKFTTEEVKGLQDGGNEVSAKRYLAKYTQNDLQKPVDKNPKRIEQWVRMVFVEKQFYSDTPVAPKTHEVIGVNPAVRPLSDILGSNVPSLQAAHATAHLTAPKAAVSIPAKPAAAPAKAARTLSDMWGSPTHSQQHFQQQSGSASVLDSDSSSASTSGWAAFSTTAAPATAASQSNTDPFGVFTASSPAPAPAATFDPFAAPAAPAAPATSAPRQLPPASSSFDPFAAPAAPAPAPATASASSGGGWAAFEASKPAPSVSSSGDWAPFGGAAAQPAPAPAAAQPPAFDPFRTTAPGAHGSDFQPFGASTAPAAAPAADHASAAAKELPSDLFAEPTFPSPRGPSFTAAPQPTWGGMPPPNGMQQHPMPGMPGSPAFPAAPQHAMQGAFPPPGGMMPGSYHGAPQQGSPTGYMQQGHVQPQGMPGAFPGMGTGSPTGVPGYGAPGPAPGMGGYGVAPVHMGGYGAAAPPQPYGGMGGPPPMMPGMSPGMAHPPPMPGYAPGMPGERRISATGSFNATSNMPGMGGMPGMPGMPGDRRTSNSGGGFAMMPGAAAPGMHMPGGNGYMPGASPHPGQVGNPFGEEPAHPPPKAEDFLFTDLVGDFSRKVSVTRQGAPAQNGHDAGHASHPPAAGAGGNPFAF